MTIIGCSNDTGQWVLFDPTCNEFMLALLVETCTVVFKTLLLKC